MSAEDRSRPGQDPRSAAFGRYLREAAASFSLSADVTGTASTADAGMALLDAALIAEAMPADDPRIRLLSEAGLFESMPQGEAAFVETREVRRAIQRSLVSGPEDGSAIIAKVAAAAVLDQPPSRDEGP
jgi:hypothetical protein